MFQNPPATPDTPVDYRLVAALSLLLSAWLIAIDPLVTRDAIIYLRTAEAYLQDGFFASQQLFGRPLLSVCVATIHQLTGISLLHSGLLLNSLFYALLCTGFVATVRTLGGGRRVQILAAIIILSHPFISESRSTIMRDPAYWAFMVLAFRELLLFAREPSLKNQLGWFACILLGTLFRFEGLFFAALAPFGLLFIHNRKHRLRDCMRLLLPQLAVIGASVVAILSYQRIVNPGARLFPDIEKHVDALLGLSQQFSEMVTASGEAMLTFTARDDAATATVAGLLAVLLLNIIRAITWPWVLTLLWGGWRGLLKRVAPGDATLLNAHLLISLFYLAAFIFINQFMLERYANIFTLFALLYLPFILQALWQGSGITAGKVAVAALLLLLSVDTLHNSKYQKIYIRDATDWIRDNTPAHASLITNDRYVAYFSRKEVAWAKGKPKNYKFDVSRLAAEPKLWRGHDYIAVAVKRRENEDWESFLKRYSLDEIAVFEGGRRGKISVVRVPQNSYPKASRSSAKHSATRASLSRS